MPQRLSGVIVVTASLLAATAQAREPADLERGGATRTFDPALDAVNRSSARLVWVDPTGVAVGVEARARDEVVSLMRRMGIDVRWRRWRDGENDDPAEIRVILLDRGATRAPGVPILGATPRSVDAPRFLWVHVPSVRAMLGFAPNGWTGGHPVSTRALAQALGRVVAHELVHALAPSVPHGVGLMSASLTRRQLTGGSLPVEPEVALAVRAALARGPALVQTDAAILAAEGAGKEIER